MGIAACLQTLHPYFDLSRYWQHYQLHYPENWCADVAAEVDSVGLVAVDTLHYYHCQ